MPANGQPILLPPANSQFAAYQRNDPIKGPKTETESTAGIFLLGDAALDFVVFSVGAVKSAKKKKSNAEVSLGFSPLVQGALLELSVRGW